MQQLPPQLWQESQRMRAVQAPIIPTVGQWIRSHPGTISLAQGVVFYPPPPQAAKAVNEFLANGEHKYGPVQGQPALRAAIAEKLLRENGIDVGDGKHRVMVTAGGNMGFLNAMFAICDPGDEVLLPLPYYFNHEMAVRMVGAVPVLVPTTSDYQLDVAALRAAITAHTRAIVTVSPNNPSGMVYPREHLAAVNSLCRETGIYHISDEAYEHFTYGDASHFSPASLPDTGDHTISIFSLSKSFGFASWRIGYTVLPPRLFPAMLKVQDTNLICASLIAQHAATAMINTATDYRREQLRLLAHVREAVLEELAALEPRCHAPTASGAFYPLQLVERLIREHRVAVLPGSAFGLDRGCSLRISYGALEPDAALAGIKRLTGGLRAILNR
jgi:aspartate/methionine/tyrosine aminotransferase